MHLQKDKLSNNSVTSKLVTYTLEVVQLGDAKTTTHELVISLLKLAMQKLIPLADVRDGLGLEGPPSSKPGSKERKEQWTRTVRPDPLLGGTSKRTQFCISSGN